MSLRAPLIVTVVTIVAVRPSTPSPPATRAIVSTPTTTTTAAAAMFRVKMSCHEQCIVAVSDSSPIPPVTIRGGGRRLLHLPPSPAPSPASSPAASSCPPVLRRRLLPLLLCAHVFLVPFHPFVPPPRRLPLFRDLHLGNVRVVVRALPVDAEPEHARRVLTPTFQGRRRRGHSVVRDQLRVRHQEKVGKGAAEKCAVDIARALGGGEVNVSATRAVHVDGGG
jgi:hypothetical protein